MPSAAHAKLASPKHDSRARLRELIAELSLLRDRTFKLASGQMSGFYFDMKRTTLHPEGANLIAEVILDLLRGDEVDAIGGLAVGAVPVVTAVCVKSYPLRPLRGFFVRENKKAHGTQTLIDGHLRDGAKVVMFDDVTTSGGSVLQAVEAVRAKGCQVDKIITIVDREAGAAENLTKHGLKLVPIFTRADFIE